MWKVCFPACSIESLASLWLLYSEGFDKREKAFVGKIVDGNTDDVGNSRPEKSERPGIGVLEMCGLGMENGFFVVIIAEQSVTAAATGQCAHARSPQKSRYTLSRLTLTISNFSHQNLTAVTPMDTRAQAVDETHVERCLWVR